MRMWVQSLASLSGLQIQCCSEFWCRLAAADPIWPLAWEFPYTAHSALKYKKKKKKKKKNKEINENPIPIIKQVLPSLPSSYVPGDY